MWEDTALNLMLKLVLSRGENLTEQKINWVIFF